jgi:hypothetical protein
MLSYFPILRAVPTSIRRPSGQNRSRCNASGGTFEAVLLTLQAVTQFRC